MAHPVAATHKRSERKSAQELGAGILTYDAAHCEDEQAKKLAIRGAPFPQNDAHPTGRPHLRAPPPGGSV